MGLLCNEDVPPPLYCASSPCMNGGICEETQIGPKCTCHSNWQGAFCEKDVDECTLLSQLCYPPSTCHNLPGTFRCICPPNATCTKNFFPTSIINLPFHITYDEIIGLLIAISILIFSCCILFCCWSFRRKSGWNRAPVNCREEFLLKNTQNHNHHNHNHNHNPKQNLTVNLKRYSKISNFETSSNCSPIANSLPQRPTSYVENLNNFDTVRSYGSAADELESLPNNPCNDFIRNLKKINPPVASVSPQLNQATADDGSQTGTNLSVNGKIQNGRLE